MSTISSWRPAVPAQRIRRALDTIKTKCDADRRTEVANGVADFLCPLGSELLFHVGLAVDAAFGDRCVELEGAPGQYDIVTAMHRQRLVETLLADIAPRADRIRDDIELHFQPPSCVSDGRLCGRERRGRKARRGRFLTGSAALAKSPAKSNGWRR